MKLHVTTARAGETCCPRCSLGYAPPEVVRAAHNNEHVRISPAQDMWALGVIAFEAVVGSVTFKLSADVADCAYGRARYPWERASAEQPAAWQQSRLRRLLQPCMSREPRQRPVAEVLLASVSKMGYTGGST